MEYSPRRRERQRHEIFVQEMKWKLLSLIQKKERSQAKRKKSDFEMEICILRERGILDGTIGKESACQCRRHKRCWFNPWAGKIPWRRVWQPIPVFLPGKSHGQRSLAVYSPQGHKESDTLKLLSMQVCLLREHKIHKSSKRPQSKMFAVEIGSWNMESIRI